MRPKQNAPGANPEAPCLMSSHAVLPTAWLLSSIGVLLQAVNTQQNAPGAKPGAPCCPSDGHAVAHRTSYLKYKQGIKDCQAHKNAPIAGGALLVVGHTMRPHTKHVRAKYKHGMKGCQQATRMPPLLGAPCKEETHGASACACVCSEMLVPWGTSHQGEQLSPNESPSHSTRGLLWWALAQVVLLPLLEGLVTLPRI
jgi:hypothetical protein